MTATEKTKAKADLKAAGCPDDCCDALLADPRVTGGFIAKLLAFIAAHPQLAADAWALVQLLLSGLTPAP